MKNKVKWLILLLILPLLCGAGEAETPAEDPRALWREAEAALEEYNYVDFDVADEVTMTFNGEETTVVMASRIRGSGLQGNSPAFQLVMTGDQIGEIYYANGTAYANMPYGQWQSPMSLEDFQRFMGENVSFTEADFAAVELVSGEKGYEISFSQPTEELTARIAEELVDGFAVVVDTDVSGTLRLHEDGRMDESVLELSMTLQQSGGGEIPVRVCSSKKLLANDERVVVYLPDKLTYFDKCEDVYAIKALYEAFSVMENATTAAYRTEVGIDAKVQNSTRVTNYVTESVLERDPFGTDYRYYYDYTEYRVGPIDITPWECYGYDLSPEEKLFLDSSRKVDIEISDEDVRDAMIAELREFNSVENFDYFEDIRAEYSEDTIEIDFRPSRELNVLLTSYLLEKQMGMRDYISAMRDIDRWEFADEAGFAVLNKKGELQSLYFSVNFTVHAGGIVTENSGKVSYQRDVKSVNGAVEFPEDFLPMWDRVMKRENG